MGIYGNIIHEDVDILIVEGRLPKEYNLSLNGYVNNRFEIYKRIKNWDDLQKTIDGFIKWANENGKEKKITNCIYNAWYWQINMILMDQDKINKGENIKYARSFNKLYQYASKYCNEKHKNRINVMIDKYKIELKKSFDDGIFDKDPPKMFKKRNKESMKNYQKDFYKDVSSISIH